MIRFRPRQPALADDHSLTSRVGTVSQRRSHGQIVATNEIRVYIDGAQTRHRTKQIVECSSIGGPRASTSGSNDVGVILGVVGRDPILRLPGRKEPASAAACTEPDRLR